MRSGARRMSDGWDGTVKRSPPHALVALVGDKLWR